MQVEFQAVLYNERHEVVTRLKPEKLKKDVEAFLKADNDYDYAYAKIDTLYVKGGEAVGG